MFLLDWYKEWIQIRQQKNVVIKEEHHCDSCETYRQQLEIANFEKKQLLDRIFELTKKEVPVERTTAVPMVTRPQAIPWRVRQQMLEAEDRAKAATERRAAKADVKEEVTLEDLEKELDNAGQQREKETGKAS